ncbi:MAG: aminopeptidase P family protein [Candidatus Diapherotrites archaeon]|nr:aminopeptidase P family protein [Candidatus Diapherotrites archaeon]
MNSTLKKAREKLEGKCDALLIASSGDNPDRNIQYYAGVDAIVSGVFYWQFNSSPFVVVGDYNQKASVRKYKREERETAYKLMGKAGGKRIGFNGDYFSVNALKRVRKRLRKYLPGAKLVDVSKELSLIRAIKTQTELKAVRKAAAITKRAFRIAEDGIQEGKRERDIFADITSFYYRKGAGLAFEPIVASGRNTLLVHTGATEKRIKPTDTVIVDTGSRWNGYCSDFTRSYCLKPNAKKKELLELVEQANALGRDIVEPGMTAGELYEATNKFFGKYAKYWPYGLGHGVGLDIHEYPSLSSESKDILEKGMVFTIEPGLAIPGIGGARLEHTGVLTSKGFRILW